MPWTSIALAMIAEGSATVDIGRPIPGAHETEFLAPDAWDPTRAHAVLADALEAVLEKVSPAVSSNDRRALATRIAKDIEHDAAVLLWHDPYLRYTGLYVYLQGSASATAAAWYDLDFAEPDRAYVEERDRIARDRAYSSMFVTDYCQRFPLHPTCRRAG